MVSKGVPTKTESIKSRVSKGKEKTSKQKKQNKRRYSKEMLPKPCVKQKPKDKHYTL